MKNAKTPRGVFAMYYSKQTIFISKNLRSKLKNFVTKRGARYSLLNNLFKGVCMEKYYQEPLIEVISMQDDLVRTSTGKDPFDDGYTDFGEN